MTYAFARVGADLKMRAEDVFIQGRRTWVRLHEKGGKLEIAQQMANHESARTTGLYDRRLDQVSLDEVERIRI